MSGRARGPQRRTGRPATYLTIPARPRGQCRVGGASWPSAAPHFPRASCLPACRGRCERARRGSRGRLLLARSFHACVLPRLRRSSGYLASSTSLPSARDAQRSALPPARRPPPAGPEQGTLHGSRRHHDRASHLAAARDGGARVAAALRPARRPCRPLVPHDRRESDAAFLAVATGRSARHVEPRCRGPAVRLRG